MRTITKVGLIITGTVIVFVITAFIMLMFFFSGVFSGGYTEDGAVKHLKQVLGLNFKGGYTVIDFYQQRHDSQMQISLKLSDDAFKEIVTYLETVNLDTETTYNKDKTVRYEDGWTKGKNVRFFERTKKRLKIKIENDNVMDEQKTENVNFYVKSHKAFHEDKMFRFSAELIILYDIKIIILNEYYIHG